jgi:hypothetical protein
MQMTGNLRVIGFNRTNNQIEDKHGKTKEKAKTLFPLLGKSFF